MGLVAAGALECGLGAGQEWLVGAVFGVAFGSGEGVGLVVRDEVGRIGGRNGRSAGHAALDAWAWAKAPMGGVADSAA